MKVTVFTPLYNREASIGKVYLSLCQQTCMDFEWLVINDGSTDNGPVIMQQIIANHNKPFPIRYYSKINEGLSRTINKGLDLADGEMFFRLDSDDVALPNSVEVIQKYFSKIKDNDGLCALVFVPLDYDGCIVGHHPFLRPTICNFSEYRDKYNATGDRAEVMKTSVFRIFKFPDISNEKFCPEGLVWNRIAREYDALYINEPLFKKGFPSDSITSRIYYVLRNNATYTTMYYKEIATDKRFSYKYRLISAIKYYRFAFYAKSPLFSGLPANIIIIGFPLGLLVCLFDLVTKR